MAYDLDWVVRFERLASDVQAALGSAWIVEHVGSTSVPGLMAKPVIDLAVRVPTTESLEKIPPRLAEQMSTTHRAYAPSRFFVVKEWGTGLLRLRATDRPGTFDEASLRHLFHAVAELLPDDPPIPWEEFALACPGPPPMFVDEDARDHR